MVSTTSKAILAVLFLGVTTTALHAQNRIDMTAVGLSVAMPGSWTDLRTWDLNEHATAHAPEFAFFHVQVIENGKFLALRREGCPAAEKQAKWVSGGIETAHMAAGDTITPLTESAAVTFNDYAGYLIVSPRESVTMKSYSFSWIEDDFCYRAQVGAPEDIFAVSNGEFQQIIDGIRPIQ